MTEPNVVLTFVEQPSGVFWIAGAVLGQLCREDNLDVQIDPQQMIDRAFSLLSFKIIRKEPQ